MLAVSNSYLLLTSRTMSHFLLFVLVRPDETDIENCVNELVDPYFDRELAERPPEQIKCDGFVIGGRYDQQIFGAPPIYNLAPPEFQKRYGLDVIKIEDNVRPAPEVPKRLIPYAVVTPEGDWFDSNDHEDWPEKVKELLKQYSDYLAVAVDCHC